MKCDYYYKRISKIKNKKIIFFIRKPLDGSKVYIYIKSYFIGYLFATKKLLKISNFFSILIIIIGFVQIVLFPFNILTYIMGIYLYKKPKDVLYLQIFYDFYKQLEKKYINIKTMPIKKILLKKDATISECLSHINFDSYIFFIIDEDDFFEVSEKEIFLYSKTFPMHTKLCDIEKENYENLSSFFDVNITN